MREDFLHYLWKFKKFDFLNAKTAGGENIQLLATGMHNENQAGPDFFNSKLKIGEQLWAGNVEIHLKSSDWYAHQHEKDTAYDNVILHVVWEHDVEVYRKDNSVIPCLTLKDYVSSNAVENYNSLLKGAAQRWINCEKDFSVFSGFTLQSWQERLYIERLEYKAELIFDLLKSSANDWEEVLFKLLAKNFGLNVNGEAFLKLAESIPFAVIRKINEVEKMEALFFGQAGMLQKELDEPYYLHLQKEYAYLQHKFQLNKAEVQVNYFRLRPTNFPTIRISQLAKLYVSVKNLFSRLIQAKTLAEIYRLLEIETSRFWKTHYTFEKESKSTRKALSKNFIDLLIINSLVPLKFCYARFNGEEISDSIFDLMRQLPAEKNSIVQGFDKIGAGKTKDAMESQAFIQLKNNYCNKHKCLQCNLGLQLLQKTGS